MPSGLSLDYSTLLGSSAGAQIRGMTTNAAGDLYITGEAFGPDFPTTPGAYQTSFAGGLDTGFVTELDPQGRIMWSTLIGSPGAGDTYCYSVALDPEGDVYVSGRASPGLATTPGVVQPGYEGVYQSGDPHGRDGGFVAKFSPDGSHLMWSTYLGNATEDVRDIKVDANGDVYALTASAGNSTLPAAWFANGYERGPGASSSGAAIVEISPDGSRVLAGSYVSGNDGPGSGNPKGDLYAIGALALDASGVYVAFPTTSTASPTLANAFQRTSGGGDDIYVAKLSLNLSNLIYGTYIGGSGTELAQTHEITVDSQGDAYVALYTTSTNLPTTNGSTFQGGPSDIYVAKISPDGSTLLAATYLGGNGSSMWPDGPSLDAQGDLYVGFNTTSTNLATTPGAVQSASAGGGDLYLAELSPNFNLLYGTYLGGSNWENNRDTVVDGSGDLYWTGDTGSGNFPTTPDPLQAQFPQQTEFQGTDDGFLVKFAPTPAPANVGLTVSPVSGAPGPVTLTATVGAGTTISQVTFYANGTSIGTVTTPTGGAYSYTWNAPAGGYLLTAVASSNQGATTASNAVQVNLQGPVNQTPVIVSAASADTYSLSGQYGGAGATYLQQTGLHVAAVDDGGSSNLTYSWVVRSQPFGAASPTFSVNNTGTSNNTTVTFHAAGTYTFQVTVKDQGGLTAVSAVTVTVQPVLASISIAGPSTVPANGYAQYTATALDQFGQPLATQPNFFFDLTTGGTISNQGLFTAPAAAGSYTITAYAGTSPPTLTGSLVVTVSGPNGQTAPSVINAALATATSNPALYNLSVLGSDSQGESNLIYTWGTYASAGHSSPGFVFGPTNGTNAGKNTTVTFSAPMTGIELIVTVFNPKTGLSVTSVVSSLTVSPVLASLAVTPGSATVPDGASEQFTALGTDQFGNVFAPAATWSILSGGGTVSANGLYTAPASGTGTVTVQASYLGKSSTATITLTSNTNNAPTVVTAAQPSLSPVTSTSVGLSVLGADATYGESALTYTWAETSGPAPVTFSTNGTNAAKNTTASFSQVGSYTFVVTLTDPASMSATSSCTALVSQVLTSIVLSPGSVSLTDGGAQQFTAIALDQFDAALANQPTVTWSIDGGGVGTVNGGLYTAPVNGSGTAVVRATANGISGTAHATTTNQPPTVATAAYPSTNPVNGTSVGLSVLGADDGGETNLTYTWTEISGPGTVSFNANGTNAAKNTTATFGQAGTYAFQVTITDQGGLSTTSGASVTVNQTLTSITVSPGTTTVADNLAQQFTATAYDQFRNALAQQPTFSWSAAGLGSVNTSGLYSAPASGTGSATVTASSGTVSGTAFVAVTSDSPPAVVNPATAAPASVNGTTTSLSVLGADATFGESALTYTWTASGPAPVTFSANGTNAAKNTVVTFGQVGTYAFVVTLTDSANLTATSTVTVTVNQTLTTIRVSPVTASVTDGFTQAFTAVGYDQFNNLLASQPTWTWSVAGLGAITSSGIYQAPYAGTGSATVTARSGSVGGSAAVNVTASAPGTDTWTGLGATNNWSEGANWNTGSAPGTGTTALFTGFSSKNAIVDSGFAGSIAALQVNAGYNGTISLNEGLTVSGSLTQNAGIYNANGFTTSVAGWTAVSGGTYLASTAGQSLAGGLTVSGGTFTGSTGTVTAGTVTLSAGTLNAPSGILNVAGGNFTYTGGIFNANGGTVSYFGTGTPTVSASGLAFNNFQDRLASYPSYLTINGTLTVNGTLSWLTTTSPIYGNIEARGNVDNENHGGIGNPYLTLDGSGNQTIEDLSGGGGGQFRTITINKSGGGVSLACNPIVFTGLTLTAGTVNAGTYSWQVGGSMSASVGLNLGNVAIAGTNVTVGGTSLQVASLSFAAAGDKLTSPGGTLFVSGNWSNSVAAAFVPNGGTVNFDGVGMQQLTSGGKAFFNITIAAGSSLVLEDDLNYAGILTNLGTLTANGHKITG